MAGFDNDIVYAKNADFSQADNQNTSESNGLITNGQLWVGTTSTNAGGTHINVGSITSPGGTITVGFSSPNITLEASASIPTTFTANSGSAIPVTNTLVIVGSTTSAGNSPLVTTGGGNTITIVAQRSQAIAATDATKVGLANFNSAQFTVDANGFVSTSGTGIPNTITPDSGGALSPTAGNWNILGGPGVTTSGSGSTLTINSIVFTDTTATTLAVDNGYFATAAGTYVLPAAPAQGEMVIIACDTAGAVVVDAPGTQLIRIGSSVSSAGGTLTSTAIGDSLTLRYRTSNTTWHAVSSMGNWTVA